SHLLSGHTALVRLAFGALEEILNPMPMRMEGRPVVAGRITPPDWQPRSPEELTACYRATFDLLHRLALSPNKELAELAQQFLVEHLTTFLNGGWLDDLKVLLARGSVPPHRLPEVVGQIETYLYHYHKPANGQGKSGGSRSYG